LISIFRTPEPDDETARLDSDLTERVTRPRLAGAGFSTTAAPLDSACSTTARAELRRRTGPDALSTASPSAERPTARGLVSRDDARDARDVRDVRARRFRFGLVVLLSASSATDSVFAALGSSATDPVWSVPPSDTATPDVEASAASASGVGVSGLARLLDPRERAAPPR